MAARITRKTIVPMSRLLPEVDAARIRRSSAPRHRMALAIAGVVMLVAIPARAEWVGDGMDLMGTRVSVELWADDAARGRELVADVMREYRSEERRVGKECIEPCRSR